jgi:hypothetical protein
VGSAPSDLCTTAPEVEAVECGPSTNGNAAAAAPRLFVVAEAATAACRPLVCIVAEVAAAAACSPTAARRLLVRVEAEASAAAACLIGPAAAVHGTTLGAAVQVRVWNWERQAPILDTAHHNLE